MCFLWKRVEGEAGCSESYAGRVKLERNAEWEGFISCNDEMVGFDNGEGLRLLGGVWGLVEIPEWSTYKLSCTGTPTKDPVRLTKRCHCHLP
jgi:hypothetical protein